MFMLSVALGILPPTRIPVTPIRAVGWHACRAPHACRSPQVVASAPDDAQQVAVKAVAESPQQQGLEELSKSVTQGLEEFDRDAAALDLDRIMGAGTVTDLSNAFGLRTSMDGLRTTFDEGLRSVLDLEAFPSLPPMVSSFDLLMLREQASSLMMGVRVAGVALLLFSIVAAVAAGLVGGDRSAPPEELCKGEEELLLKEMSTERAELWDRGGWRSAVDPEVEECEVDAQALPRARLHIGFRGRDQEERESRSDHGSHLFVCRRAPGASLRGCGWSLGCAWRSTSRATRAISTPPSARPPTWCLPSCSLSRSSCFSAGRQWRSSPSGRRRCP